MHEPLAVKHGFNKKIMADNITDSTLKMEGRVHWIVGYSIPVQ